MYRAYILSYLQLPIVDGVASDWERNNIVLYRC